MDRVTLIKHGPVIKAIVHQGGFVFRMLIHKGLQFNSSNLNVTDLKDEVNIISCINQFSKIKTFSKQRELISKVSKRG